MKRAHLLWCLLVVAIVLPAAPAAANVRSQTLYARGLIPYNSGEWDQAFRLFNEAVQADPTDALAIYYRGLTQARRGQRRQALDDLEAALQLDPTLPHGALDLGIASFDAGQYEVAKTWLQRAHEQPGDRFQAALFLGFTLYRLHDDAGALNYFKEAETDPELRPTAHYYAGLALLRQGKSSAARDEFADVAREQPQWEIGKLAHGYAGGTEIRQPPPPGVPSGKPWSVSAEVDLQYDSNVKIAPSDSALKTAQGIGREDDGSTVIAAGGSYRLLDTDLGSLRGEYDFSQSIHFDLTQFDLQGHRVRLDAVSKPGTVRYGMSGTYNFYLLDYQTFFQEILGTPWVAFAENDSAVTQAYYTIRGRDFFRGPYDPGRNGFNNAVGVRQYVALGSFDRTLSLGYQFDAEETGSGDAAGRDFQYKGNQFDVGLNLPVSVVTLDLGYLFRLEDYQFPNSRANFAFRRHDHEHQFVVALAHPLTSEVTLTLAYIGVINGSNISNFDYDRNLVSVGARVTF